MKKRLHITIDKELYNYLSKEAKKNGHSISYYIRLLILKDKISNDLNQS